MNEENQAQQCLSKELIIQIIGKEGKNTSALLPFLPLLLYSHLTPSWQDAKLPIPSE